MTVDITQLLPYLSPTAQAFIQQALSQGQQDVVDMILQIVQSAPDPQQGIAAVEQSIQEFMQQMGMSGPPQAPGAPGGAVDPSQVPVDPSMGSVVPGGAGAPGDPSTMGAPPPGMDPSMMGGGPPPGGDPGLGGPAPGPRDDGPQAAASQRPQTRKPKEPPKYKAPAIPQVDKPTYDQIMEDARSGRTYWSARDRRIKDDYDLYHLVLDGETLTGTSPLTAGGDILHRRSQPNTLVNLVTSLVTPKNGKLVTEMEPRSEDQTYKSASQDCEDAVLCWREYDEDSWLENRINEPPLPRKEAGLATLEGGFGWSWAVDPDDEDHPFKYEVIPLSQLYDVGHATTRQYSLPLHQARARIKQVAEYYKLEDKGKLWDPNQKVRIIVHADNYGVYRSIVWEELSANRLGNSVKSGTGDSFGEGDEKWILKPERINYGFRYFSYMVWGGSPAEALLYDDNEFLKYKGHGVLTMLRKTFRLMDLFISAIASGALRNVNPPYVIETDAPNPQPLNRGQNAFNTIRRGDKVSPLVWDVSGSQDAQNLMNSLIAELQDVSSPALMGAGGVSGVAQQISTEQASQQVVGPIIDAMEKWYGLMHKQRLILALRYSGDTKYNVDDKGNDNTLFDKYPKRRIREEGRGQYGHVTAKDIGMAGVRVTVRYTDRNVQEDMALSQMVTGLVNAHLMSQETALRKMGVKDPQQEMMRILGDGAFMEPTVLKALVETAVYNSGNQTLIDAWDKAFYADMVKGANGGSQPAETGTPSMASQPGVNATGTSSAVQAPGQQQMGQQQY
jgi:hypothetical protein